MSVAARHGSLALLILAAVALHGMAGAAKASVAGENPCPASPANSLPWVGELAAEKITVPSVTAPGAEYPGTIVRPRRLPSGRVPVVVLQHGWGGDQCNLWWIALTLASRGYAVEVHSARFDANPVLAYQSAVDATRSALANLSAVDGGAGPLRGKLDLDRLGLGGHSLGSIVASSLQGDPELGIKAILATDTLRRYAFGDPGGAINECVTPPVESSQVVPRVPALSFAKDEPCDLRPDFAPPDLKLSGPRWWTSHGIPNIQLVMRDHQHNTFGHTGSVDQRRDLAGWIVPWFDRWLKGDRKADDKLLARKVGDRPTSELLSTRFQSSACLPGRVDTEDYRGWVASGRGPARTSCDRFDPPRPVVSKLRVSVNRRAVRPRRSVTLTLRVHNSGYGRASGLGVRLRSSARHLRLPRSVKLGVPPRQTAVRRVRVRIGARARGRVAVTAKLAGRSATIRFRVKRGRSR